MMCLWWMRCVCCWCFTHNVYSDGNSWANLTCWILLLQQRQFTTWNGKHGWNQKYDPWKSSEVFNPRHEAIRPFEMDITTPSVLGIHFGICWKVSLVVFGMHALPKPEDYSRKRGIPGPLHLKNEAIWIFTVGRVYIPRVPKYPFSIFTSTMSIICHI